MNTKNAEPISFPPGSFTLADLEKVAKVAADAKEDERDTKVAEAFAKHNQRVDADAELGRLPGHKVVKVEHVYAEGTEVDLGRGKTEVVGRVVQDQFIQVFDPKNAIEEATAAAEATGAVAASESADRS